MPTPTRSVAPPPQTTADARAPLGLNISGSMAPIRSATTADAESIAALYNALLESTTYEWRETPYTVGDRTRWLLDRQAVGDPVLVATDNNEVVGVASYGDFRCSVRWPGYRFTIEHSIHIAEGYWGRGLGRALMGELASHARRRQKRVMVAGIDGSNGPSVEFHRRLGFVEVARMPGVGDKWGQRLDLILMQCDLGDVDG